MNINNIIIIAERDLVGLDSKGNHVLFVSSEADFDENVTFRKSLLRR